MSIINSALKKLGKQRNAPKVPKIAQIVRKDVRPKPDRSWKRDRWRVLIIAVLICGFGLLLSEVPRKAGLNDGRSNLASDGRSGQVQLMQVAVGTSSQTLRRAPVPALFPPGTFYLTGILWDRDRSYALINNQVVESGDALGGATVREISERNVILETDKGLIVLDLL